MNAESPARFFNEVVQAYFRPETEFIARIIENAVGKPGQDHQVRFAMLVMIGLGETFGMYGHPLCKKGRIGLADRQPRD